MEKKLARILYMEEVVITPLSGFIRDGYFAARGPEGNDSHRLNRYVYFIISDVQIKDAIDSTHWDSLTAGASTRADCKRAKMVYTHNKEGDYKESEEGLYVPQIGIYFISSEFPED